MLEVHEVNDAVAGIRMWLLDKLLRAAFGHVTTSCEYSLHQFLAPLSAAAAAAAAAAVTNSDLVSIFVNCKDQNMQSGSSMHLQRGHQALAVTCSVCSTTCCSQRMRTARG